MPPLAGVASTPHHRPAACLDSTRLGKVRPEATEHDAVPTPTAYEIEAAEEPLALKPCLLQDTYRGRVGRVARCRQSLEPQPLEAEVDQESSHFGCVTTAPAV